MLLRVWDLRKKMESREYLTLYGTHVYNFISTNTIKGHYEAGTVMITTISYYKSKFTLTLTIFMVDTPHCELKWYLNL